MAVIPLEQGDGRYDVVTEDEDVYTVTLPRGSCTCPDHQNRGAHCKHVRRVAMAITADRVPSPGEVTVDCAVCGRATFVPAAADPPHFCATHQLVRGGAARDRETGDRVVVVAVSDRPADEVRVPAADCTVADYHTNRAYPDDDPVVVAVYPAVDLTEDGPVPDSLRAYSFPASRLRPIGAD